MDIILGGVFVLVIITEADPFSVMAIYTIPLVNELSSFIMDGITTDIFFSIFQGDFRPLTDFINASINLLAGRTVKNKCNIGDYSSRREMNRYCYQWNVPACRLNIGTMYKIALIFWFVIFDKFSSVMFLISATFLAISNKNFGSFLFPRMG